MLTEHEMLELTAPTTRRNGAHAWKAILVRLTG